MDREEQIKARAHAIWEQEGRPEARSQEHWERAEREVDAEAAQHGGNEETGAALASAAIAEAPEQTGDESEGTAREDDGANQGGEEGSAQLHENVTGSPHARPLGKKSPAKKR